MLRRLRWPLLALLALGIACDVLAVRMPTRATAGSSISIDVDFRALADATNDYAVHCAMLPAGWTVTAATFTRSLSGVNSSGALIANAAEATALNGNAGVAGYTWRCYQTVAEIAYSTFDFGTSHLTVTVGAAGDYQPRFTFTDGAGGVNGIAYRNITIDGVPDWRSDLRPLALATDTTDWNQVESTSDSGFVAVDGAGDIHQTVNGGLTWVNHTIAAAAWTGVERFAGLFIVVGTSGRIYSASTPTNTWTQRTSGTTTGLNDICNDGGTAYVVGDNGYIAASTNGTTWSSAVIGGLGNVIACAGVPASGGAYAVTSTGHAFHIVGTTPPTIDHNIAVTGSGLYSIAFTATPQATIFVLGDSGAAFRSFDGTAYASISSPTPHTVTRLRIFGGVLYALDSPQDIAFTNEGSVFATPLDTIAWKNLGSGVSVGQNDIAISGRAAVTVGERGVRLRAGAPSLTYEATTVALHPTDVNVAVDDTFTIRNNGSGVLYLGTPQVTAPFTVNDNCIDRALDPGEGCDVTVALISATPGIFNGTVTMPNNGVATGSVAVSGLVGAEATIVAPATLDFGNVPVGATASREVTLRNGGVAPLTIASVGSGVTPVPPYAIIANGCFGLTLAASATCVVTVAFHPTGGGGSAQAFDVVSNDAAHPSVFVQLVGTGAAPSDIRIDGPLAFDDVPLEDSKEVALVVRNVGGGPLDVASISSDSAEFTVVDASAFTVASGETAQRMIRFAPTADGPRSATLTLATNDPDAAAKTVAASGNGVAPQLGSDGGGCAAVTPVWLALLATCCAYAACRGASPRHRRRAPSHV